MSNVEVDPRVPKLQRKAMSAYEAGKFRDAEEAFERVLRIAPDFVDGHYLLGTLLAQRGELTRAEQHLRRAAILAPYSPHVKTNLGLVLMYRGELAVAETQFREALDLDPSLPQALNNLGALLVRRGALSEALEFLGVAVANHPEFAEAHVNRGNAYKEQGLLTDALECYQTARRLQPNLGTANSNYVMASLYDPDLDARDVSSRAMAWGEAQKAESASAPRARKKAVGERLRIGYLSPDFCAHPVGFLIEPVLAEHDRERFEIFCYDDGNARDAVNERLRRATSRWRDVARYDNPALLRTMRTDKLDVLVDLTGHSAGNRLSLFTLQPAPVQVAFLGYPATTGLRSMQYILTDDTLDQPAVDQARYTERLYSLGRSFFCFRPPADYPVVTPSPAQRNGFVTFGSFNALFKIGTATLNSWAEILTRMPNARLVMQAKGLSDAPVRRRIATFFRERRIAEERVTLHGHMPLHEHLTLYGDVDITLDTYPWNGHMTTLNSLWMGVPVVTRTGDRRAARMGQSILQNLGMEGWVARDEAEYVQRAITLAGQAEALAQLRDTLRDRMSHSVLTDARGFVRGLEAAYLAVYEHAIQRPD